MQGYYESNQKHGLVENDLTCSHSLPRPQVTSLPVSIASGKRATVKSNLNKKKFFKITNTSRRVVDEETLT